MGGFRALQSRVGPQLQLCSLAVLASQLQVLVNQSLDDPQPLLASYHQQPAL